MEDDYIILLIDGNIKMKNGERDSREACIILFCSAVHGRELSDMELSLFFICCNFLIK
jgi:hypothetical protein